MDTIAKYLSSELSFFQITWARYFFTVLFTLPLMFFFFRKNLTWSTQPKLQIFRGLTLFLANILFFYSISIISMAKALTLAFVAPLITTALSPIFLGEKVGFSRKRGGLGSAIAVFQSNDVVFPQVIPELDFDELHQFLSLVGQGVFFLQRNVD